MANKEDVEYWRKQVQHFQDLMDGYDDEGKEHDLFYQHYFEEQEKYISYIEDNGYDIYS